MRQKPKGLALWCTAAVALGGCTGPQIALNRPEPRPLGEGIRAFEALQPPPSRDLGRVLQEPTGPLQLRMALSLALMKNPDLAAFSWEVRALDARALQAGLLPNPELVLEIENFAGTGEASAFDIAESTISLGQLILPAGKRGKRQRVAGFDRDLAGWDYESKRMDIFTEVTKTFVGVLAAQERVTLAEELVGLAQEALQTAARQVNAGAATPVEETRARVELATIEVDREKARHELAGARKRLAATWGSTDAVFSGAVAELSAITAPPAFEELTRRVEKNPDLDRWVSELEQRKAVLALEKARRYPDVRVGVGVRRLSDSDDTAFVVEVGLPLRIFDRNQGAILEASHRLA